MQNLSGGREGKERKERLDHDALFLTSRKLKDGRRGKGEKEGRDGREGRGEWKDGIYRTKT